MERQQTNKNKIRVPKKKKNRKKDPSTHIKPKNSKQAKAFFKEVAVAAKKRDVFTKRFDTPQHTFTC